MGFLNGPITGYGLLNLGIKNTYGDLSFWQPQLCVADLSEKLFSHLGGTDCRQYFQSLGIKILIQLMGSNKPFNFHPYKEEEVK